MAQKPQIHICYLCGKELGSNITKDHVPPRQFYPSNFRAEHNVNLFTLPVHEGCNTSYQLDEDYFINSLAPLANDDTYAGREMWNDLCNQYRRPQTKKLRAMILNEFVENPGGLYLPDGKIIKKSDHPRLARVLWKIVRGLFFAQKGRFLPEGTQKIVEIYGREDVPADRVRQIIAPIMRSKSCGKYPEVFDYKFMDGTGNKGLNHCWGLFIWDFFFVFVLFREDALPQDSTFG